MGWSFARRPFLIAGPCVVEPGDVLPRVAEALARECLSLPIFPGITEPQLAAVVDAVRAFFDG